MTDKILPHRSTGGSSEEEAVSDLDLTNVCYCACAYYFILLYIDGVFVCPLPLSPPRHTVVYPGERGRWKERLGGFQQGSGGAWFVCLIFAWIFR